VSRKALFVFSDTASLEQFYRNVKSSTTEITVPYLAEVLGGQIINDTVKFITELAYEVHKAVRFNTFWAESSRCCLS
jgi:hypothetical protein